MQTVLKVEGLIKIYGTRRVVDGVSFHVDHGEIVGLLGPNGAGKTTSFRMACGLINTNGGIVYLGNEDVTNWPMYRRSRDGGMGYLPQDKSVFQKLSVQNNLYGVMEMIGMKSADRKKRCEELLEKFRLTHLRHNYGGGLSGGERRRLEIARSLVSNPKIILLDEPFAAVDPITVASIQEIIRQLAAEGISILITDHSVDDTLEITQRSYVIQAGKVLCHGTPSEVLANPEARKVYFGENINRDKFRDDESSKHRNELPREEHRQHHRHHSEPKPEYRDPEWDITALIPSKQPVQHTHSVPPAEKVEKHEPVSAPHTLPVPRPKFHPSPPDAATALTPVVETVSVQEDRKLRPGKRLRPSASSITMPEPLIHQQTTQPTSTEPNNEQPPTMSGIIKSLGQMVWKK